jgi:hypothetical protein
MEAALQRLGERCPAGSEIVLAGGSALVLGCFIRRGTSDGNVVVSRPRLAELRRHIDTVADELGRPAGWLNDGVKAWADVLPPDFPIRMQRVGTFGNLEVQRLGRRHLLVMKFASLRAADLDDLDERAPTAEEIAFLRGQLGSIAALYPDHAVRMELYPAQGEPDAIAGKEDAAG